MTVEGLEILLKQAFAEQSKEEKQIQVEAAEKGLLKMEIERKAKQIRDLEVECNILVNMLSSEGIKGVEDISKDVMQIYR